MQTIIVYISSLLALFFSYRNFPLPATLHKDCADLAVKSIGKPEWDLAKKQTTVKVIIENKGDTPSDSTTLYMEDEDVDGYSDALTSQATILQYGNKKKLTKQFIQIVPPIDPDQKAEYTFTFDYWVYDPDCELRAVIDPKGKLTSDCHKENNVLTFREHGNKKH